MTLSVSLYTWLLAVVMLLVVHRAQVLSLLILMEVVMVLASVWLLAGEGVGRVLSLFVLVGGSVALSVTLVVCASRLTSVSSVSVSIL